MFKVALGFNLLVFLLFSTICVSEEDLKGQIIYQVPENSIRSLTIAWEMPDSLDAPQIVGGLLCQKAKGSLLDALRHERLAENVEYRTVRNNPKTCEFALKIDLSVFGVKRAYTVIEMCFQAIALLREKGVPDYLYDEMQRLAEIESLRAKSYDREAVKQFISQLTPLNCIFSLQAPETELPVKMIGERTAVRPMPVAKLTAWSMIKPHPALCLPLPNPYIPHALTLHSHPNPHEDLKSLLPHPSLIANQKEGMIYFAQDARFKVPRISWSIEIKSPEIDAGFARKTVLTDLYIKAAKEVLGANAYAARLAGLEFNLKPTENGIQILVDGYCEHAERFLFELLEDLKQLKVSPERFKEHREALFKIYHKAVVENPLLQAMDVMRSILYRDFTLNREKEIIVKKITFETFEEFCSNLFKKVYVEGMLYGNMTAKEAENLSQRIFYALASAKPYPKNEQLKKKILVLPEEKGPYFTEVKSKVRGNVAILAIQELPFSFKSRAAQQILMMAMKEPFTSVLSKQQSGLTVLVTGEEIEQFLFSFFAVQSFSHDPRDLLARFELFIEDFLQNLDDKEIPLQYFESIRNQVILKLGRTPKNMSEMVDVLRQLAFRYDGDFDWQEKELRGVHELSYTEFLDFCRQNMGKENKRRLGVFFSGALAPSTTIQYKRLGTLGQIRKVSKYEDAFTVEE